MTNSFDKAIGAIMWIVVLSIGAILIWMLPVVYGMALIAATVGFFAMLAFQMLNQRRIDRRAVDFDQGIGMPEASALQNRIDGIHAQSVKELKTAVSGDTSTALKQGLADAFARSDEQRQIEAETAMYEDMTGDIGGMSSDQGSPRVIQSIERIAGPALVLIALVFVFQALGLLF